MKVTRVKKKGENGKKGGGEDTIILTNNFCYLQKHKTAFKLLDPYLRVLTKCKLRKKLSTQTFFFFFLGEPSVLAGVSVLTALRQAIAAARQDAALPSWFQLGK